MTALLGAGDSFHLIPRSYALWTPSGLEANAAALGLGKFITSITMTIFYLLLYYIWRDRYQIKERKTLQSQCGYFQSLELHYVCYRKMTGLSTTSLSRSEFCVIFLLPSWGIIIIVIFCTGGRKSADSIFRFMPLAVALSFGFYLPVVLFSGILPAIGALMIPKTLAYVWIVLMSWRLYQQSQKI